VTLTWRTVGEGSHETGLALGASGASNGTEALRNDTFAAPGVGGEGLFVVDPESELNVSATNLIASGGEEDIGGNAGDMGEITVAIDHSNYATVSSGSEVTVTPQ
jgi:hypothetical protein